MFYEVIHRYCSDPGINYWRLTMFYEVIHRFTFSNAEEHDDIEAFRKTCPEWRESETSKYTTFEHREHFQGVFKEDLDDDN